LTCDRCGRTGLLSGDLLAQFVGYAASANVAQPMRAKRATGKLVCSRCIIQLEHGTPGQAQGAMF